MAQITSRLLIRFSILTAALCLLPKFVMAAPALDKIGGPASCAECHLQEIEAWKLTVHFKTLNTMNRRPEAAAITTKLGLKGMKSEGRCVACHYTSELIDGQGQVTTGISCESCHGAGADWVNVHGNYGKGVTKATESAEHRTTRRTTAVANGMLNPDNLYVVGANCYSCHLLDDEKLVNGGGHSLGSPGFDLLTWSQGEVRHTILSHDNKANPAATPARRRELYVVGCILETEFTFRVLARATEKAPFGLNSARRADAARKQLEKIQSLAPTPELIPIIAIAQAAGLRLKNAAALTAAADQISTLGHEFAARVTGDRLAGIDILLPDQSHDKGTPYQVITKP